MKRTFAAIAVSGLLLVLGLAQPAAAAGGSGVGSSAVSAAMAGPCGSSYQHVGHYPINASGTLGYIDVYWSGSAKRNCAVVNHSSRTYGVSLYTQATIRPSGWSWPSCPSSTGCDGGFYGYYAGPVYTPAGVNMSNRCLDVKGVVDWAQRTVTRIHCG